jgi:DNA-binding LacI/PurR family transcriptional regulator
MTTLKDIAKYAKVSVMTVSRVINTPELVKGETREKVNRAIKVLNYSQNTLAKALVKGYTHIIYIYIPSTYEITTPFVSETVASIGERLGEYGYSFFFGRKPYSDELCDGVIYTGLNIEDEDDFISLSSKKPAVLFGNSERFPNRVDIDNYFGEYLMTEKMIEKGKKKLAYIGLKYNALYAKQRHRGFLNCLKEHGIAFDDRFIILGDNSEGEGFNNAKRILESDGGDKIDGIVCASDIIGIGVIHYLKRIKAKIPEDIAVGGFDGFGFEKMIYPSLATIKQPLYDAGRLLADKIVENIKSKKKQNKGIYIKPIFEEGDSL